MIGLYHNSSHYRERKTTGFWVTSWSIYRGVGSLVRENEEASDA